MSIFESILSKTALAVIFEKYKILNNFCIKNMPNCLCCYKKNYSI